MESIALLDATNFFWRAFHSPGTNLSCYCKGCGGAGHFDNDLRRPCKSCLGTGREPTKAVYTFIRQIAKLLTLKPPAYACCAFDGPREELRRRGICESYKANRADNKAEHPESGPQLIRCKQLLKAFGICCHACRGYEADDAIASLAVAAARRGIRSRIYSRDKDLLALCGMSRLITVIDPMTGERYGHLNAGRKWGIRARQIPDFLCLCGDSADNVPGIAGVGEKGAAKLLSQYGNLLDIYNAAKRGEIKGRVGESLKNGWEILRLNQKLLDLDCELPLWDTLALPFRGLRWAKAGPIMAGLNFNVGRLRAEIQ